ERAYCRRTASQLAPSGFVPRPPRASEVATVIHPPRSTRPASCRGPRQRPLCGRDARSGLASRYAADRTTDPRQRSSSGLSRGGSGVDPNLFHLDWQRTLEVLAGIVLLAFIVERALSLLFENRWWLDRMDKRVSKELLAFAVASGVCIYLKFDALSMI